MIDTSLLNIIGGVFNTITLIDVNSDKVSFLDGSHSLSVVSSNTYEEYYDKIKKVLHPDYVNDFFDKISLNNLKSINDYDTYKYLKLSSNLNYEMYTDIIKLLDNNQILLLTIKTGEKSNIKNDNNALSYSYADLIINIEQMIDNIKTNDYETENIIKYIINLLNDSKMKNKSVLKSYQDKVALEANKTYKSLIIADDDNLTRSIFKKVFESDYKIIEAKNGSEAVEILENNLIKEQNENIVGMFLDLKMPVMDGFAVLDYMNSKHLVTRLPVIIISADDAKETKEQVYLYDIADMIEKPFNFEIIKKRVNNMVSMYSKSNTLKNILNNRNLEVKNLFNLYKHTYLVNHAKILEISCNYLKVLLTKYNESLDKKININLYLDSYKYYDLGIGLVPSTYFSNSNNLSTDDKKIIFDYPINGSKIVNYLFEDVDDNQKELIKDIILLHNERFDGNGFPNHIKEIPMYIYLINIAIEIASNIIQGHKFDDVVSIIKNKANSKYSIDSVNIFIDTVDKLKEITA